jgi:acyl-CoA synthetase (AMP-forming)/AMP-acid ligase II
MSHVQTLIDLFARNADRELLYDVRTDERLSYGALLDGARRLAGALREQGVKPGTAVAVSAENAVELALLAFACLHLRARLVPINPAYHPRDYAGILSSEGEALLLTAPAVLARLEGVLADLAGVRILCFETRAEPARADRRHLLNFDLAAALARQPDDGAALDSAADEDVCLTVYTSGTTSAPKGVDLTCAGLLGNGLAFCRQLGLGREHRFFNVLPMTYLGGLYNLLLIPILAEGSVVIDSTFGVGNLYSFWEKVQHAGVNTLWFTSTMLSMLLSVDEETATAPPIKLALCGMAPLPVDLKRRFEQRFGCPMYENYGITETTFLTTNRPALPYKPGSAGTPLPGVEIEIVDQQLRRLPAGAEGQILVRTPYLMKGYRRCGRGDEANLLPDGGFLTGDIGRLADGELFVTGRLKDLIIRGGINISPKALEDTIYRLPGIAEVAVVGVPHPIYGEEVAAVVKVHPAHSERLGTADVKKFCEEHIANFQRPKLVYLVDELPRGATGKVQKNVLRRLIAEKLNPLSV